MTLAVIYQPPLLSDFLRLLLCDHARGFEQVLDVELPVAYPADLAPRERTGTLAVLLLNALGSLSVGSHFLTQLFLCLQAWELSSFDYTDLANWVPTEFTRWF